jgi:hypothetical protein
LELEDCRPGEGTPSPDEQEAGAGGQNQDEREGTPSYTRVGKPCRAHDQTAHQGVKEKGATIAAPGDSFSNSECGHREYDGWRKEDNRIPQRCEAVETGEDQGGSKSELGRHGPGRYVFSGLARAS